MPKIRTPNYTTDECPHCKNKTILVVDNELECKSCGAAWLITNKQKASYCSTGSCSLG